ncbi:hypothetical protein IE81DRAFT_64875 [Ceraceosorus guamensis]|uniref:Uncharacterized protein n=1 Tax=Ceraceosorus guamensis TaxID=1522189 RepID=A0A316W1E6_9BASI|nr:hypothetical protein IE81DRAFT_64875 [Ceraceosorus guamensis]PWN43676.1 hypothetical protein IE81DRAFT_64875 [Ceraceosorus guamensis]
MKRLGRQLFALRDPQQTHLDGYGQSHLMRAKVPLLARVEASLDAGGCEKSGYYGRIQGAGRQNMLVFFSVQRIAKRSTTRKMARVARLLYLLRRAFVQLVRPRLLVVRKVETDLSSSFLTMTGIEGRSRARIPVNACGSRERMDAREKPPTSSFGWVCQFASATAGAKQQDTMTKSALSVTHLQKSRPQAMKLHRSN